MREWGEDLSVNIAEIDEQHRKIFKDINTLLTAMKGGRTSASLRPQFDALLAFAGEHFRTEELLMKKFDYPGFIMHRHDHQNITRQAKELHDQSDIGKEPLSEGILSFLSNWLVGHITKTDKEYSKYLNDRGIT